MDRIRIGNFELYPAERMLCMDGTRVELGARAFDLLLVLVEHDGRLVTKSTLLERVWPRLVVDENNIPAQIASLRRVLGAGAIHTVQGFGYRLELPVLRTGAPALAESTRDGDRAPSLTIPRKAWPERLGSLVGREGDVRALETALDSSSLVTIVGIAGVGKTRVAQEIMAARTLTPGALVAWVALAPLADVQRVPSAIALALGLPLPDDKEGFVALQQALENIPLLLILDSAEHLGEALAAPLARLILATRGVRALITSQAPLGIMGETVYRLAPLAVPSPHDESLHAAEGYAAVALFARRAAAADRRFELSAANSTLVVEICRRLDGIPLALELAAARVPALGLATVLERLNDRFRLLKAAGHSLDERHSTLHTAFDWSYALLTQREQSVFDKLAVFAGGFSLKAAAESVADGEIDASEAMDLIGRLVDRSLVTALGVDPPRYSLLETARYYALGKLDQKGASDAARGRTAMSMLNLLDVAYQEYWSADEALWLHRYEPELDNVRAAMDWAMDHDRELGVALFGSSWPLFVETDLHAEGRDRYAHALTLLTDSQLPVRVGRFWEAIATYDSTRQCDRARFAAELAAAKYAAAGDDRARYYALMLLAGNWRVDTESAWSTFETARALEDPAWPARVLSFGALTFGALLTSAGRFGEARATYQRAVRLALTTSERQALVGTSNVVELDVACGDTSAALQLGRPLALSLQHLGRRETHFELLTTLFSALLMVGERAEARATGMALYEHAGRFDASKLYTVLDAMAFMACEDARYDAAACIVLCSDAAHVAHGQGRRRPTEERMRRSVVGLLERHLGSSWQEACGEGQLSETQACALALGFDA